jgi:hypothetical protein
MKNHSIRKLFLIFSILVAGWMANGCAPAATQVPTGSPSPNIKPTTAGAVASPISSSTLETTSNQLPAKASLGQLTLQYPILMNPGASKTVSLQISIPAELASASPESFKRDVRSADSPRLLGKFNEYSALVLVTKKMRVEIVAPNFNIQDLYPAEQDLDVGTPEAITRWGWTITAPGEPNEYVLVLKVYMANQATPSWVGSFDVIVAAPTKEPQATASPSTTPTPFSTGERILRNIADNAVTLITALLTAMVALLGLYFQYRKPKEPKK